MTNKLISALFLLALIASLSLTVLSINIEPAQSTTPNCAVSGHVYSATGNPTSSALTYLIDTATGHGAANCYSDYSGFYYLTVPAGTYILVSYISGTAQVYSQQNIVITKDSTIDINLIVGLKVSCHVMDSSGHPVVGAQTSMHNSTWTAPNVSTDAYGNFTVYAPAGTYRLILWPPTNSRLINYQNESFTVNSETSCNISMSDGYKVSGYVCYPSGDAVSGVSTMLINGSGYAYSSGYWSDTTGFYSIVVPPGTYSLRARVNHSIVSYFEPNISINNDTTRNIQLITASISPTSATIDEGQSYPFTATAQGGSGTYITYVWYVNGVAKTATSNPTFNFEPTAAGTYTIDVTVQDSLSASSTRSTTALATVNSALTMPDPSTSVGAIDQGQTCQLSANEASTGTAPYTYQWYGKEPGASTFSAISNATALDYIFSTSDSTAVGEWQFILNVTDSASKPNTASSNITSIFLIAPPSVTVSPESAVLDAASTKTFNAIASNGLGSLTYRWFLDGVKVGGNNTSFPYVATAGNHTLYCNVTDSASPPLTGTSNTVTITTNPALTASVVSSINQTIDQGQPLWLNATAPTDGTPPYSYQWFAMDPSGNYSVIQNATVLNYQVATLNNITAGNWTFVLHITDSATMPVTVISNSITVTVNPAPSVVVSPDSATFTVGQSSTFTAVAAGGSGNYSGYQWYVNGAAQQGQTSTTFTFSPSSTGSYYSITATVTDSLGATSNMSTAAQVQTAPASTPAPTQTPTLTAAPIATPKPTATPISTPTPTTMQNPTATPLSTQPTPTQNVTQGPDTGTYVIVLIALAVVAVVLAGFILALKKTKKSKKP